MKSICHKILEINDITLPNLVNWKACEGLTTTQTPEVMLMALLCLQKVKQYGAPSTCADYQDIQIKEPFHKLLHKLQAAFHTHSARMHQCVPT